MRRAFQRWVHQGAFESLLGAVSSMVDARGLPIAVSTGRASPHESQLVEPFFDLMVTVDFPEDLFAPKIPFCSAFP